MMALTDPFTIDKVLPTEIKIQSHQSYDVRFDIMEQNMK